MSRMFVHLSIFFLGKEETEENTISKHFRIDARINVEF